MQRVVALKPPEPPADPAANAGEEVNGPAEAGLGRIGPYLLLERVGEGGFGEVFRAEQETPFRRVVALKIIKAGSSSSEVLARFESERRAHSSMNHTHVAHALDAGTAPDGRPFFVMEFVPGLPITEFCDRNDFTLEQRLGLFQQCCRGIQHAHHKGIIHRDLKPNNILVTTQDDQPVVKIIDFGVAKAVGKDLSGQDAVTEFGQLIGTPDYMSPEQVDLSSHNLDTRTDIYSLGVLLYELSVGELPFDAGQLRAAGYTGMRRIIREEEPIRPSRRLSRLGPRAGEIARRRGLDPRGLQRRLSGDLEWVILKAMQKDRSVRYATASELAADVIRHLANQPVTVGPPSFLYHLRKFVRRHRTLAVSGLIVFLSLTIGLYEVVSGLVLQREARIAAQREVARTDAAMSFMLRILESHDPEIAGTEITVAQALEGAAREIDDMFEDEPDLEAAVRAVLGKYYLAMGLLEKSEPQVRAALELRRRLFGPDDPQTLRSGASLGLLLLEQGRLEDAEKELLNSLERRTRVLGEHALETIDSTFLLARVRMARGRLESALGLFRRTLELAHETEMQDDWRLAVYHREYGSSLGQSGDMVKARAEWEASHRLFIDSLGEDHRLTQEAAALIR